MENQRYVQGDEICIRDYVNVIIKRKKFILSIFFVAMVIAVIANLLEPKIYEINTTIQLGYINGPLIKNQEAKAIILNRNSLASIIDDLDLKMTAESLQGNIKISDESGTNLLRIRITYPNIDIALKISEAIVNPIITQWQNMYKERLTIVNERLTELNSEIKNVEEDITRTQDLISGFPHSPNISQSDASLRVILLQNTLPNYESNLTMLRNQRNELKLTLVDAKDFKVFDPPIKPAYPVVSDTKKNVMTVGIMSLAFGILLSFFVEFWQKNKIGEPEI